MSAQISAYAAIDAKHTGIRVALCEPDSSIRQQISAAIDSDPLLILAAESQSWSECEACLDSVVPELLIVRSELLPSAWGNRGSDHFQPVLIPLRTTLTFPKAEQNDLRVPADPQSIKATLDRAVCDIYDRKAKQLLFLVDHYVAGSRALATFKSFLQAECEGHPIDVRSDSITSIVAARKHVLINSVTGQFLLREPIHRVADDLDPAFFIRIHRSIIVNLHHIDPSRTSPTNPYQVILSDGSRYRVGPNYREALAAALRRKIA